MDTNQQIKALEDRIAMLENAVRSLTSAPDVSADVKKSLQLVLGTLVQASKAASSEDRAVNEGGSSSYSVLKPPDGFDQRNDGGTVKYYPYYL